MNGTRLVLVGYGRIAEKHLEVFRDLGADVVAACNRSEVNRQRAARDGRVGRVYSDPIEMVERERPEGILVTASALSLFEVTRALLPVGLPLLVEKPPGTSLAEARQLAAMAEVHGTPVMVGLNRRFYSVYHTALKRMGGREAVTGVWVEWSEDPGRMLEAGHPLELLPLLNFANSLHGIDLLPFFTGVLAVQRVWGRDLDPTGKGWRWQMTLDGIGQRGAAAHFCSTWDAPGRWRLVVDARAQRLVSAPLETGQLLGRSGPQDVEPSPEDRQFKPGFHGQAQAFLSVVRDRAPIGWPACSVGDAVESMQLAELLTDACWGSRGGAAAG